MYPLPGVAYARGAAGLPLCGTGRRARQRLAMYPIALRFQLQEQKNPSRPATVKMEQNSYESDTVRDYYVYIDISPNQVLTHAARAAASQLNKHL